MRQFLTTVIFAFLPVFAFGVCDAEGTEKENESDNVEESWFAQDSTSYSLLDKSFSHSLFLTEEQVIELRQRYSNALVELQSMLAEIGNCQLPQSTRQKFLENCLKLFLYQGEKSLVYTYKNNELLRKQRLKPYLYKLCSSLGDKHLKNHVIASDYVIINRNVEDCGDGIFRIKVKLKPIRNSDGSYTECENPQKADSYLYIKRIEVGKESIYKPLLTNVILENI